MGGRESRNLGPGLSSSGHRHSRAEGLESQRFPRAHRAKGETSQTARQEEMGSSELVSRPAQSLRGGEKAERAKSPGSRLSKSGGPFCSQHSGHRPTRPGKSAQASAPTQLWEAQPCTNTLLVCRRATSTVPFIPKRKDLSFTQQ